jgi:hypothetical protein
MIISHKHKFIFVKTKKTAGSTLEKLLFPYLGPDDVCTGSTRDNTPALNIAPDQNGHMAWDMIQNQYSFDWKDYYKFTIERNPWDKCVSSYYWHQKIKPERFGDMPFPQYILNNPMLPVDWLNYTHNGNLMVDDVFKYEDMWGMYQTLNDKFGFDIKQEQVTGTKLKSGIRKTTDYKELYDDATVRAVATLFANEIKLLGYEYETTS